jgi:hypothetical protein
VTFFARRIGMFAFKSEFAVAVVDKKQIGFFPAPKRMAFYAIGCTCVFMGILVTIGASFGVQAYVLCALMHPVGAIAKVALVTRQLAVFPIEPEPGKIMVKRGGIEPADVTFGAEMFAVTTAALTCEFSVVANTVRHDLADSIMASETSI